MLIKALTIFLMFAVFIFIFSYLSESETLDKVTISENFEIKNISGWKLQLVENGIYELSQNSENQINKIEFFTLDSLVFSDSTLTEKIAKKVVDSEIVGYEKSKLNYSNGFLEHLRNHKFYTLENAHFFAKKWFVLTLTNSEKQTSVWVNVFTILENEIFVFRLFYNVEDLKEVVPKEKITKFLRQFLATNSKVKK